MNFQLIYFPFLSTLSWPPKQFTWCEGQWHDEIIILIQESHSPFPPRKIIYLLFCHNDELTEEWMEQRAGEWVKERVKKMEQNKSIRIFLSQAIWNANEFSIFSSRLEFMEINRKQKSPKREAFESTIRVNVCLEWCGVYVNDLRTMTNNGL